MNVSANGVPGDVSKAEKPDGGLTPLKRAFLALESARAKVAAIEAARHAPVAIIGIGCRVPGGGHDADSFWTLMRDGVDAISRVPDDRWDIEAVFDPDPGSPGTIATREGGFIDAPDRFDAEFFGISPREAQGMDPQQRLMLEVAWEALENAGKAPDRLERSATGVYMGVCSSDYTYLQVQAGDRSLYDAHFTSGIAHSVFSGRLSYLLGLQGPSLTIDTACSSSLVAVHLAIQSLRSGESRMALAGGVNLMLAPDIFIALSHSRMLAPDGRCKTFDAAADGFARGEGCGVVVLKLLADAQADGDRILAVIRGSAVNQDGPSSGLTAPNGPAQEAVIRAALSDARLEPRQVGYIEAHGTGTQLGDPLEVHALGAVFGSDRNGTPPLVIGSVKTNIGHLEAAAGVTGLIKLVLALAHATIPKHLHFRTPSPHIHWSEFPLVVPTEPMPWLPIDGRRIGAVSSFGFSGTNAHLIVEEPPAIDTRTPRSERAELFTLSARDLPALRELAAHTARTLKQRGAVELADVCHASNHGRAHLAHRATLVARTIAELVDGLEALAAGDAFAGLRVAHTTRRDPPRVAMLFTGQGSQYVGMARGLYDASPVFRDALDRCAAGLAPHLEHPLLEVLFAADPRLAQLVDETGYTQPALFAVGHALTELWRSWGVRPDVLIGHSVGEVLAACVAGVMSLDDGLRLVAMRGRLMQSLPVGGAMAAIAASEADVARELVPFAATVSIAAVNAGEQTVISGTAGDVEALTRSFSARGLRCQPLTVSHAFHSPLVDPILDDFEREVAAMQLRPPSARVISNLSGRVATAAELTQPRYWRRHVREGVRFGDGLQTLHDLRPDLLIEIGPQPTLLSFARDVFQEATPRIASLRKGVSDWEQFLDAVASTYLAGAVLDWRAPSMGVAGGTPRLVDLPGYPFRRTRHWFQARREVVPATRAGSGTGHALLGTRLRTATESAIFESSAGADRPPFVRHHRVLSHVVIPATAWLDTLLAVGRILLRNEAVQVVDVVIQEAMLLADDGSERLLQSVAEPARGGAFGVTISSQPVDADAGDGWVTHARAQLTAQAPDAPERVDLRELRTRCAAQLDVEDFYAGFARRGLDFGVAFRTLRQIQHAEAVSADHPREALGLVEVAATFAGGADGWVVHPLLLDGCLQVMAAAIDADGDGAGDEMLYLPIGIGTYRVHSRPALRCWCHAVVQPGTESRRADLTLCDDDGTVLARVQQVQLKRVARDALDRLGDRWLEQSLLEVRWQDAGPVAPVPVVAPRLLGEAAALRLDELRDAAGVASYDRFLPQFEALCAEYTVAALRDLGWKPAVGEHVEAAVLAQRLGVIEPHRRQFARLLAILGEVGLLQRVGASGWRVAAPLPPVEPASTAARLRESCPAGAEAELEMTIRVASAMASALRGEREPMDLLFPGGSLDTAERMYRDSPTARLYNGLLVEALAAAVTARRGGPALRILEIGAGTGGTTAYVLERLAGEAIEYTYTDVGALFVARARERFAAHAFMRFEVLDLERDFASQGFAGRQFDVVIASNVVHATTDLRRTLARLHGVMAPDALLVLLEVTAPQRWFDLTVGLTSGWWAFTDADLRPDYPTLPREHWVELLAATGFDDTAALPPREVSSGCLALESLLLSRRAGRGAERATLVVADHGDFASGLAVRLRARGERCIVVRDVPTAAGADEARLDTNDAGAWRDLLARLVTEGVTVARVIHLASLDLSARSRAGARSDDGTGVVIGAMRLAQALVSQASVPRLCLVTSAAQPVDGASEAVLADGALLWGLARALRLEHPELRTVTVDLDADAHGDTGEWDALLNEIEDNQVEPQIAWRHGQRRVARLSPLRTTQQRPDRAPSAWRLGPALAGSLDRMQQQPAQRRSPGDGEVEITVEATGLNFKDVLNALGMYPGDPGPLGGECAGTISALGRGVSGLRVGDPVMAVAGGSFASHVIARAELVQLRPPGVGPEEGAAFSIPYLTAEFCLGHLARLQRGQRVLIHAAAGGVGMAAVHLARLAGAEVFATAGSAKKRALLETLGVSHVFDSRTVDFASQVLGVTGGQGVDVVLNSLSGESIEASFSVLARGGSFVEIGKRGIKTEAWVRDLQRDLRYHVVDWGETAARDPDLVGEMFARLGEQLRRSALPPLPRHEFALSGAARAFRFMAQARHTGKIVVRHGAKTPFRARRDGSYLVTGGLSGLGLEVARWLAAQGAGRLVLIGRREPTAATARILEALRADGTDVLTETLDVSDERGLRKLLTRVRESGPPLRGVWHSAGVLDDGGLLQQDDARFARVLAPKVHGGRLLDELTRADPLDAFVLFSSVAGLLGSAGQANHSAANAWLDALAHERASAGLPALAINWSVWAQIGAAADRRITDRLASQGLRAITPAQGMVAMQRLLDAGVVQAAVLPIDWSRYLAQADPRALQAFASEVAGVARESVAGTKDPDAHPVVEQLFDRLAAATPLRRRSIVAEFVQEHALRTLGVDPSRSIDPRMPLGELGLDSLLAVELRNTLGHGLGRALPATLLFDYPTLDALTDHLLTSVIDDVAPSAPAAGAPAAHGPVSTVAAIEDMSDDEIDRQLALRAQRKN